MAIRMDLMTVLKKNTEGDRSLMDYCVIIKIKSKQLNR